MSQVVSSSTSPVQTAAQRGVSRFTLPAWVVSILLHAALLVGFATLTWTVSQRRPDQTFTVGIMLKKDTPQGQTFENQDTTFVQREDQATAETKFLPDTEATAASAPKMPDVDLSAIGIAGSTLAGTGDLMAIPDGGLVTGAMTSVRFFDAQAWGNKFVFVIDRSGSMMERDRLGAAKRELLGALGKLPPEAQFQIIFYNLNQEMMPVGGAAKRLQYASELNKARAGQFVEKQVAEGGTSHLPALKSAIALQPDVIFFLTDADDLRAGEVKDATDLNKDRARIHTIAFGVGPEVDGQNTLRDLADRNGGSYRYIDAARPSRRVGEGVP